MSEIVLPWPHRWLHPNSRPHWTQKATAAKNARTFAAFSALEQGIRGMSAEALSVTVTFHPPDKRRRDLDGMLTAVKNYLDGIADVVGVDDSKWSISMSRAEPRKGGAVLVRLEAA